MPSLPFKKKGDKIAAWEWNSLVTLLANHHRKQDKQPIIIYNNTDNEVPQHGILGVDGLHEGFTPSDSEMLFKEPNTIILDGIIPTTEDHENKFVVIQEKAAQGQPVPAKGFGYAKILLDVIDEDHKYATVADEEYTHLTTSDAGHIIIWKDTEENENEEGLRWAIILLGGGGGGGGLFAKATLAEDLEEDDEYGYVDNIVCTDGGTLPESITSSSSSGQGTEVENRFGDCGNEGDPCEIKVDKSTDPYSLIFLRVYITSTEECPPSSSAGE